MKRFLKFFSKRKSRLEPMGVRSIYPFDYNKNNPFADQACERWMLFVAASVFMLRMIELRKAIQAGGPFPNDKFTHVDEVKAKMNMESLVKQAQQIVKGECDHGG